MLALVTGTSFGFQSKIEPLEAKILQVQTFGFSFQTNLGSFSIKTEPKTQFWKNFIQATKQDFQPGEMVWLTTRETKKDGTTLLEITDPKTGAWLKDRRNDLQVARLVGGNPKELVFEFADGSRFVYGYTSKTRILIEGKVAQIGDIRLNAIYYLQPRTSANLISFLSTLRNAPILQKSPTILTGYLSEVSADMKVFTISQNEGEEVRLATDKSSILNLKSVNVDQITKEKRVYCRVKFRVEKSGLKIVESIDAIH